MISDYSETTTRPGEARSGASNEAISRY